MLGRDHECVNVGAWTKDSEAVAAECEDPAS